MKATVEYGFLKNVPVEGTVNSMEPKTGVFCKTDVQEFHLSLLSKLCATGTLSLLGVHG